MLVDSITIVPYALLFLRIIIAIIFFSSGKSHFQHSVERGKSIGLPANFTKLLGAVEVIAAFSIAVGLFLQIGALLLIFVMLGAIQKKIFIWKTEFYEDKGYGWHYDLLLLLGLLVIFATGGGHFTII